MVKNRYADCDTDNVKVGSQVWAACNVGSRTAGVGASSYGPYVQLSGAKCEPGWHVATKSDWSNAYAILGPDLITDLKLPAAGMQDAF